MDVRQYPTKDLPYHFVLFYNLSREELLKYSLDVPAMPGDNAILTYCYIDRMAGMSFKMVCLARYDRGEIICREQSKTIMMTIREGALVSDAVVFPEGGMFAKYQELADRVKENYGYHIDVIEAIEKKSFPDRRHVCYPDDVMVVLYGMGMKPEQIWVSDITEEEYPKEIRNLIGTKIVHTTRDGIEEMKFVGAGRLINEPFDSGYGYRNGSIVPVYSLEGEDGTEIPIVPANGMWPRE